MPSSRAAVLALVLVTGAAIGYAHVYLPFLSDASGQRRRRQQQQQQHDGDGPAGAAPHRPSNSMWRKPPQP